MARSPPRKSREGRAMAEDDLVTKLTQKMLRRKLYVVLAKPVRGFESMKPYLAAHLDYMIGLEKKGVLFASGPLSDAEGNPRGDGLTILRAASATEARRIVESDPFFVNGLRTFELREWTLMEGSFGLRVHYSDQSIEVE
jgi:uncharacterized protein YciI